MLRSGPHLSSLILILVALSACKPYQREKDETQVAAGDFAAVYAGTYIDVQANGLMQFTADGKFYKSGTFQIGREGTEIPYPTTCTVFYAGYLTRVYKPIRDHFFATHSLNIELSLVRLVEDSTENSNINACRKFVAQEKMKMTRPLRLGVEAVSTNHLRLHQSGGSDYRKGEPRTASTLDENFYREGTEPNE